MTLGTHDDRPGFFHCLDCDADYPDTIKEAHEESHAANDTPVSIAGRVRPETVFFWASCIGIGVAAGLFVNTVI